MLGFLKSMAGIKASEIGQNFVAGIVSLDPESASKAQLEVMEQDLDKAGQVIQKLHSEYERELREATSVESKYNQLLKAAEVLSAKEQTTDITNSLNKLLAQLEELSPTVDQEKQDVLDAKSLLDQAQAVYKEKAEAITQAKHGLERARRDMERAEMDQERAKEKAERAAEVAGLRTNNINSLNVATVAMQKKADEAKAAAEAAKLKASTLTGLSNSTVGDANIEAALKEVKTGAAPTASAADRLAALRKK